jgi:hypothetical protein
MKTEQPHQPTTPAKASAAELRQTSSDPDGAHLEPGQTTRDASIMSFPLRPPQSRTADPIERWSRVRTLRFALISCGVFWVFAGLLAWAFLRAH